MAARKPLVAPALLVLLPQLLLPLPLPLPLPQLLPLPLPLRSLPPLANQGWEHLPW